MRINYFAVLMDETGCEFAATVLASSREEAWIILGDRYPESSIVQLESPEDTRLREESVYADALEEEYGYHYDNDNEEDY